MTMTSSVTAPTRPVLSLPPEESRKLREVYRKANVILEYGSGGSTVLASEMPDKLIFSVESDYDWALNLQMYITQNPLPSPAIVHYVDIGKVGAWGRPVNSEDWKKFHRYPLDIWERPFFRHPDVVLIDGRFRAACLAVTRLKISRPVKVLFDDYLERPMYHEVERLAGKPRIVGRMGIFNVDPAPISAESLGDLMSFMSQATYDGPDATYKARTSEAS